MRPHWSMWLSDELWLRCVTRNSTRFESCFELPVGSMLDRAIPLELPSESQKIAFYKKWKHIFRPAIFPSNPTRIEWRNLALSEVTWRPARRNSKDATPPDADWIFARWAAQDLALTVDTYSRLTWDCIRVTIEAPPSRTICFQDPLDIDKDALLELLTQVFVLPWESTDDFRLTSSISPTPPGYRMAIQEVVRRANTQPIPFQLGSFAVKGLDPQYVLVGVCEPMIYGH